MADSTTNLVELSESQDNQEAVVNELIDAASPSTYFGRNAATCSGLTWGYFGGKYLASGLPTSVANGTVAITASSTRYVEINQSGVISANSTRSPTRCPLYTVVSDGSTITSYTDERDPAAIARYFEGRTSQAMADANQTITQAQSLCRTIVTTGALTATRNLVVPLKNATWTIRNECTGGSIQVIGSSGTGITIATGKTAIVYCDQTNVLRVTADV